MLFRSKTGTYYWRIKGKMYSRNFTKLNTAKKYLKERIMKDKSILGRNQLYYTKSILLDVPIGYFGTSGKWMGNR